MKHRLCIHLCWNCCRTFTGAWIETLTQPNNHKWLKVAPSRVRGLKRNLAGNIVDCRRRTFTGAWIETRIKEGRRGACVVAPSRVRGLKPSTAKLFIKTDDVAPSRVRGLKPYRSGYCGAHYVVAPSRVRGLKPRAYTTCRNCVSRTFTGAWIETQSRI